MIPAETEAMTALRIMLTLVSEVSSGSTQPIVHRANIVRPSDFAVGVWGAAFLSRSLHARQGAGPFPNHRVYVGSVSLARLKPTPS